MGRIIGLWVLASCGGNKDAQGLGVGDTGTEASGGAGGGDADTDVDADADVDADTDADTDPGTDTTTTVPTWHFTGTVSAGPGLAHWGGEVSVGLVNVEWNSSFADAEYLDTWKRHTVGSALPASFDFGMPDVPPANFLVESAAFAGVLEARFLPVAWVEKTGDGAPGAADDLIASSMDHLIYLEGALPPALTDLGLDEGWNFLRIGADFSTSGEHISADYATSLVGTLLPKAAGGELRVNVVPAFPVPPDGTLRLDVFSLNEVAFGYGVAAPTLASASLVADMPNQVLEFDLPDPPSDHYLPEVFSSTSAAQYQLIAYVDRNGDGLWQLGVDSRLATSDPEMHYAHFRYTALDAWLIAPELGGAGWTRYTSDGLGGITLVDFPSPADVDVF